MATIVLVRHGDTSTTKGKFHGLNDDPMTSAGRRQVESSVDDLESLEPEKIYYSPMKRTKETAQIIADKLHIPIQPNKALLPLDLGKFVGQPTNESNTESVRHYLSNPDEVIPEGQSVNEWAGHYLPFFNQVRKDKRNDTVIFVTHGRNIVLSKAGLRHDDGKFDKRVLVENQQATEHGGYALVNGNTFKVVTPKKVAAGQS